MTCYKEKIFNENWSQKLAGFWQDGKIDMAIETQDSWVMVRVGDGATFQLQVVKKKGQ